jgi:hypothetical protein
MRVIVDYSVTHEGETFIDSYPSTTDDLPNVGETINVHIDGRTRRVVVKGIRPTALYRGKHHVKMDCAAR